MSFLPASYWIKKYQLHSHIEGGSFGEVYRSDISLDQSALPTTFNGNRNAATHIYFLLEQGQFSAFHKISADELWHFYYGDPITIYELDTKGNLIEHLLGNDPEKGQSHFIVIKGGNWFASKPVDGAVYGLVGCTVAPGFDFADFELAKVNELVALYPSHDELIRRLCR